MRAGKPASVEQETDYLASQVSSVLRKIFSLLLNLDLWVFCLCFVSEVDNYPNHECLCSPGVTPGRCSDGSTAHALLSEGEEHTCPTILFHCYGVRRSGAEEASLDSQLGCGFSDLQPFQSYR